MSLRPVVLLLIPHLGGGGAERVVEHLARHLSPQRYRVHLGLVTQSSIAARNLPASVAIHGLDLARVRAAARPLLRLIGHVQPDVIVSGMAHLNILVLLLRPLIPRTTRIVIRQNGLASTPSVANNQYLSQWLYRVLYPRANRIICQSAQMRDEFASCLRVERKTVILPNPVNLDAMRSLRSASRWHGPGPHLLAIGRLSREKGFDLAIQALAAVRDEFPAADLTIFGRGPDEQFLKAMRDRLGLNAAVSMPGYTDHPAEWFPGATLFVSSSRHDALPNAMLEAAASGLPIVATPARGGIPDLLRDQPGIWLSQEISPHSLATALCTALRALQPGDRFPHTCIEPFDIDRVIARYEALIDEVLCEPA